MTYDDWKTTPPDDEPEVEPDEPDWDALNDAKRDEALDTRPEICYTGV
jgi:hypothetical protein